MSKDVKKPSEEIREIFKVSNPIGIFMPNHVEQAILDYLDKEHDEFINGFGQTYK